MRSARLAAVVLATAAMAASGCRGGGDDDVTVDGGVGGDSGGGDGSTPGDITIYDIQMGQIPVGTAVSIKGVVVTAIDRYGARTNGFYVEEPGGGAFSGVYVFGATAVAVDALAIGDLVDIQGGKVDEFDCGGCGTPPSPFPDAQTLTEIDPVTGGTLTVTKTGTGTVPAAQVVDSVLMATDPVEAEKWEGVLIELQNVAVTRGPNTQTDPDRVDMDVTGPLTVAANMVVLDPMTISRDDCYASITGIGDYFYEYKLLPRMGTDLVVAGDMSACAYEDSVAECSGDAAMTDDDHDGFVNCADFSCQVADPSCVTDSTIPDIQMGLVPLNTKVRVNGIVTARASATVWVQDAAGGQYSGIAVLPTAPPDMALVPGTKVTVEGNYDEYFCLSEINNAVITITGADVPPTPILIADPSTLVDVGPPAVPPSMCAGPGTTEPYEGVLVQIQNVRVVAAPDMFGEWTVQTSTTPLHVDNIMYVPNPAPVAMACYGTISGVMHFSFDVPKLEPRSAADVVVGVMCP